MNEELRKILGFYSNAHTAEKEITDYIWNSLYDDLFIPVYEHIVDKVTKELDKLPPNPHMTSKEIIQKLELQRALREFATKMQKRAV